jgi:hypothetical protein
MVAQVRSGVFPVWVGQSIYQFNGAIYSLRVAPAFHYLGAMLDVLTRHSLGIFGLQNLLIILIGVVTMATAYFSLRALLPARRWIAAGLAALFLSCPGVLGISYNSDLYMSWTTLPMIPLVWFATVRSFQNRGSMGTLVLLGASLGCCWWGHSPIALWSTLIAGAAQIARIGIQLRGGISWVAIIAGGLTFAAISAYPVGSVLLYPPEPGVRADSFQAATAGNIIYFLRKAFPATFLPMSTAGGTTAAGRSLGDFQLGYSLWVVLVVSIWSQRRNWKPASGVPVAAAAILAVLLLPIPGLDSSLWSAVPAFIRNTTGNWVMNRLYLPLAAATVFGAAASVSAGQFDSGRRMRLFELVLAAGCLWSLTEAAKFAAGSQQSAHSPGSAVDMLRPENVQITRFSYLVFPSIPSTFTHGVTDPGLENHLLARGSFALVASDIGAAMASGQQEAAGDFYWNPGGASDHVDLATTFRIAPSRSYLIDVEFAQPAAVTGILQILGTHFFREYALPEYGGPRAFGAGGDHAKAFPVWTTDGPEDLTVRYVPESPFPANSAVPAIAHVKLLSYDRSKLPVRVSSWIPYRATVDSTSPAWLETPRMYQTGYRATVDGQPAEVGKSPDGFVCVAVPPGESSVELAYVAPAGLRFLFSLSLIAIIAVAIWGAAGWILHLLRVPTPA